MLIADTVSQSCQCQALLHRGEDAHHYFARLLQGVVMTEAAVDGHAKDYFVPLEMETVQVLRILIPLLIHLLPVTLHHHQVERITCV